MLVASEVEEKSSWFSERWMVMWRLQRIILFIFCSFVFSTSVASAQLVQLSDLGAEQFYQGLEIIAGQLHESSELGDLVHIGIDPPGSPYDTYITVWDGNMIYIFANRAGYVSKVVVAGVKEHDLQVMTKTATVVLAVSYCSGLTEQEISSLQYSKAIDTGAVSIWGSQVHRRIAVEFYVYKNQANCFRFVAYDS